MKLFFDARYIEIKGQSGISRYSIELGAALMAQIAVEKTNNFKLTFLIHDDAQRAFLPEGAPYLKIHAPTSWKEPFTAFVLNRHQPDIIFSPMQTMGSLGRRYKLILTLHDLIYYRHRTPPPQFNWLIRLGWRLYHATYIPQRIALNGADIVATVSETSKQDILAAKLTKRPIVVIYNAPQNLRKHLKSDVSIKQSPRNLIYMGSFMEYKNVETLIRGMARLPTFTLHLLSRIRPERQAELEALIPDSATVVFHNGVTDEAYAALLSDRALLVNASFDEGYGIPVADALALGVPGVISDMPIFHEVAGNGVLYFNSKSPEDFAAKVKQAAVPATYQALSKKALQQSSRFSWNTSARVLRNTAINLIK